MSAPNPNAATAQSAQFNDTTWMESCFKCGAPKPILLVLQEYRAMVDPYDGNAAVGVNGKIIYAQPQVKWCLECLFELAREQGLCK